MNKLQRIVYYLLGFFSRRRIYISQQCAGFKMGTFWKKKTQLKPPPLTFPPPRTRAATVTNISFGIDFQPSSTVQNLASGVGGLNPSSQGYSIPYRSDKTFGSLKRECFAYSTTFLFGPFENCHGL